MPAFGIRWSCWPIRTTEFAVGTVRVTVISFDARMLVPSGMRRACLIDALRAQELDSVAEPARFAGDAWVHGRTFEEIVQAEWATHERVQRDPALLALIALDAEARYARWLRDGAQLPMAPAEWMREISDGHSRRVILRSDARRRDVIPFLERWQLHDAFAMIRCADDPPVAASVERSSIGRSWEAIRERLERWRVAPSAVEIAGEEDQSQMIARRFVAGGHLPMPED